MGFGSTALRVCFIPIMVLDRESVNDCLVSTLTQVGDFRGAMTNTLDLMLMKTEFYILCWPTRCYTTYTPTA